MTINVVIVHCAVIKESALDLVSIKMLLALQ